MKCLSRAGQESKYFIQIRSSKNSYKIGNIIAIFKMRKLRPKRVKQHSWSHTARKWRAQSQPKQCNPEPVLLSPPWWVLLHLLPHSTRYEMHDARSASRQQQPGDPAWPAGFGLQTTTSVLTWISTLLAHSTDFRLATMEWANYLK